jgi:diguanylate cyclase (GGDEF)-like protein
VLPARPLKKSAEYKERHCTSKPPAQCGTIVSGGELIDRPELRNGDPDKRIAELAAALREAEARIRYLENLAHFDELTGILNRRGFLRELSRAASYAQRYAIPVTLILLDLDGFKEINDRHGHLAGDAVLVQVARIMVSSVRGSDVVARIGGDEFALILLHADIAAAAQSMIGLQQRLGRARVALEGGSIQIEASIGLAPLTGGAPVDHVLEEADQSLYAAKQYRRESPLGSFKR